MKVGQLLGDSWRKFGLLVLNGLARSGGYSVEEHHYGSSPRQALDWYMKSPDLPTVIFFYGGTWQTGDKRDFRFVADTISTMECNVVVANYRLYPEFLFGDILKDAVDAANYSMRELAPEGPIVLMGHSAGAQMAALLALDESLLEQNERILAMVGLSGPYDFYPFDHDYQWKLFGPEEKYPLSQPVNYVRADAPKLYLLHGRDDNTVRRGHSKSLMEKQQAAGGWAEREVYEGMGHVDAVVSFSRIHRRNSKLIRDIQSFVRQETQGENCGVK